MTVASESDANFILIDQLKVLENWDMKNFSTIDDKTLVQELSFRKNNGQQDTVIRYIQCVPKIIDFRK